MALSQKGVRVHLYWDPDQKKGQLRKQRLENIATWLKEHRGQDFDIRDAAMWWAMVEVFDMVANRWLQEKLELERRQKELMGYK
jgi:hypothetical protein